MSGASDSKFAARQMNGTTELKFPTLLEGEALAMWMELTEDQQKSYATAKKEMEANLLALYHWRTFIDANCSLKKLYLFSFTNSSDS